MIIPGNVTEEIVLKSGLVVRKKPFLKIKN